jgi:glycosyltransferase involved in cell wall biosynthesis
MVAYTFYENDNRVMRYAETLARRGHEVDIFALGRAGKAPHETVNGVNVFRIQKRDVNEKGKLTYLYRILKFLVKSAWTLSIKHLMKRYDLIHVHSVPDFEVFAALLPKVMGAKVILDIHDIVPEFYKSKFKTDNDSMAFKALLLAEKASIKFSDHVIISNHLWGETLKSRSVSADKCTVIMNYPDQEVFFRRDRTREDGKFVMLYPGTLNWHQGLDLAVKAVSLVREIQPQMELHIYGEGPSRPDLERLIQELGLENRVYLKGLIPIAQIAEVMSNADVGVIPKRNDGFGGEAFSTKTLEFMSLGVPIIVARTRIDSYYFNDSIVKFFEPENEKDLAEAMVSLAKDKELREQLTENATRFVQEQNWDVKKHIYLDLVDSLCKK